MIKVKTHLKDLYRVSPGKTRKGYLRLDMNEGVPGLPVNFVKSVLSKIDAELLSAYPEYHGLQENIARHNRLSPENICLANGSDGAIKYIFDAYISPGDKVLVTDPTFAMYPVYCSMFGAKAISIPYRQDLSFPAGEFLKAISSGLKAAVVVNPNNPTGSVLKKNDLQKIMKKCAKKNVLLIVDEAYFYFYPETVIGSVKKYSNLIVLRTFSKLCGMAGGRVGYAAASPDIVEALRRVRPSFDINSLGVIFAQKILDDKSVIKGLIKNTDEGKKYLIKKLDSEGIGYKKGYANFILIDCAGRVEDVKKKLYNEKIIVSGGFRQDYLKNYIRVTIGDIKSMKLFWKKFISICKSGA